MVVASYAKNACSRWSSHISRSACPHFGRNYVVPRSTAANAVVSNRNKYSGTDRRNTMNTDAMRIVAAIPKGSPVLLQLQSTQGSRRSQALVINPTAVRLENGWVTI